MYIHVHSRVNSRNIHACALRGGVFPSFQLLRTFVFVDGGARLVSSDLSSPAALRVQYECRPRVDSAFSIILYQATLK